MPSTLQFKSFFLKTLISIASSKETQSNIIIGADLTLFSNNEHKEKIAQYGLSHFAETTQKNLFLCIEQALSQTKKKFSQRGNDRDLTAQIKKDLQGLIPALVESPSVYLLDDELIEEEDIAFFFIKTNSTKKLKDLTPPSFISQSIRFFKTYRDELIIATGLTAVASATLLTTKR